jgi:2-polyprenyl-3-methyl-5-hydroxy-6-metoxy-1,4-benzoquinol methylase
MKPLDCMNIYEDAEFYDQEFANRGHEIPFFLKQAKSAGGAVLEVACGTGRITLPIARAGIEITGLDISRPMLERARHKAEAERLAVTWLEQDCRQITADRTFSLIFSATNAMQHLHDLDSVNAFLTSAKQALRPGGTLILDVFNPNPAKLARTIATRYHHKTFMDATGGELRVEAASEYISATQTLGFTLFYLRKGELARTKKVNMRCFFPEELMALCSFNGLKVVHRYGDYGETPFTSNSAKQILVCRTASEAEVLI